MKGKRKDNRPPKEERTLKRGDVRDDGMVFWGYAPYCKDGEQWKTPESLDEVQQRVRDQKAHRRLNNAEKISEDGKRYYQENRERILAKRKEYHQKNSDKIHAKTAEYYQKNKESIKLRSSIWRLENPDRYNKWYRDRRKSNPCFRLSSNMRSRISSAISGQRAMKKGNAFELTGCSDDELRDHLEGKFTDGMSWDNYGEWHVDHIRPCASFDLTLDEEQKKCFHYSNLQPLWAEDNLRKGDKWNG